MSIKNESSKKYSLQRKLGVDIISAISSSALVAPAISIIDQAIFSNASGKQTMIESITSSAKLLVLSPHRFLRQPQFLWIWGVYSGTYIVANCAETISKNFGIDYALPKFITSSIANISLSLAKDGYYTKKFGTVSKGPVPKISYACYAARDSSTILASFILPKYASKYLQDKGVGSKTADVSSQLLTPCIVQFASTPLHLYGMDMYNNPSHTTTDRFQFIKREYGKTVSARIARIFPAFGIGGVTNTWMRATF
jgi:hypothetical protein